MALDARRSEDRMNVEAVRATAEDGEADDQLVLAAAKALGMSPKEIERRRNAEPEWFDGVIAKYELGGKK